MEKMQKETCDAVLIFPPIRLSVLLIYFREKSRDCIESSQMFWILKIATDLHSNYTFILRN